MITVPVFRQKIQPKAHKTASTPTTSAEVTQVTSKEVGADQDGESPVEVLGFAEALERICTIRLHGDITDRSYTPKETRRVQLALFCQTMEPSTTSIFHLFFFSFLIFLLPFTLSFSFSVPLVLVYLFSQPSYSLSLIHSLSISANYSECKPVRSKVEWFARWLHHKYVLCLSACLRRR